ncbi:MAG: periplasmic heavy metal sensor [Nitrospirae bacterium]|nr:periplasmic heavy metal sensor [Nitrospirota bacterium]
MNVKVLTGILAVMMLLGLGLQPVWADEGYGDSKGYRGGHGYRGHGMVGHHGSTSHYLRHLLKHHKEIGLTDEQVAKLKAIQLDLDRTRIRTEAEVLVAERELTALVEDEKTDLSTIEAKIKQSESLEVGLRMAAIKAKRDAVALLTPEQREKEKAEHEKMMQQRRADGMGGGMMGGGMMGGGHGGPPKAEPKMGDEKKGDDKKERTH